ncbi:MAG: F0F1 ATP synthase subunit delta [Bacilli bacterium]|jgi:F-type H+-transporting ATPase subunit delta
MNELYNRYALALLDLAKEENKVVEYRQEVDSLLTVIKDNPEIMKFFGSYYTSEEAKNALIDEKLSKYYSKNVINFIKVILKNNRSMYLYKIFKETLFRFDDYLNIEEGKIYSTLPLSKKDMDRIIEVIERNTDKKIVLTNVIDPKLIGGIKVVLKNDIYDASLVTQVDELKSRLLRKGS